MTNYIIQGNINFFSELMNEEDNDETVNTNVNTSVNNSLNTNVHDINKTKSLELKECCLISNQPLDKTEIKLECNHSFNYKNLYNEISLNQKKGYCSTSFHNSYETDKVGHNQIKCPYCRRIFNHILPMALNIEGVQNKLYINQPKTMSMKINCCFKADDEMKCDAFAYVTNEGIFCKKHYKKTISLKNKPIICLKQEKINASKKQSESKIETDDFTEDMIMFGNSCTLFYLKNILKENKLKVSGNKKELIKRVYDNNLQQK